jgi:hypothetical protein
MKAMNNMNFKYELKVILKCLWAIRDEDEFYFMAYGEDFINRLVNQRAREIIEEQKPTGCKSPEKK